MSDRIADDHGRAKHAAQIDFFNALIIDLKPLELDKPPREPITMARLEDATANLSILEQCREITHWK